VVLAGVVDDVALRVGLGVALLFVFALEAGDRRRTQARNSPAVCRQPRGSTRSWTLAVIWSELASVAWARIRAFG
jgi:hypothetical protein